MTETLLHDCLTYGGIGIGLFLMWRFLLALVRLPFGGETLPTIVDITYKHRAPIGGHGKSEQRRLLKAQRAQRAHYAARDYWLGGWYRWQQRRAARALRSRIWRQLRSLPKGVVGGYVPMAGEMDVMPLLRRLHARGWHVALPCIEAPANTLIFRAWRPDDALITGAHGIAQPNPLAPQLAPEVLLMPLVGFDAHGSRLGMGGGWYDRTLAHWRGARPLCIGVAYDAQELPVIATEAHDVPLDAIATETRLIQPR